MDGTLLNTERFYSQGWVETADKFGLERKPELGTLMSGLGKGKFQEILRKMYPDSEFDVDEYVENVVAFAKSEADKNLELMPGVEEILKYFKSQNVLMAVASSTFTPTVEKHLTRAGIIKYFGAVIGGDQVQIGKPAPDIFIKAAKALNLEPDDCYVFEDSFSGIQAGHSAGALAIMIPDQRQPTEEIKKICKVYDNLNIAMQDIKNGNI